ncbi:MAG TPA: GNAT family N-acetyltransferase [Chloroflexaceae bacterium]|nr:GNAT family N-acetyltransferase [Chloroflexaceae bacterium]
MTLTLKTRAPMQITVADPRHAAAHLTVRSAEPDDIGALHRLYAEPHIVRGTSATPLARRDETRAWLEAALADAHLLVAAAGDELAGALLLKPLHHMPLRHVGQITRVGVGAAWQGRGVASRLVGEAVRLADNWLGLLRLELLVFPDNAAAVGLYRKHGFREEGRLRGYALRDGAFHDVLAMARLRGPLAGAR